MSSQFSSYRTQEVPTVSAAATACRKGGASFARDRIVLLLPLRGLVLSRVEALLSARGGFASGGGP